MKIRITDAVDLTYIEGMEQEQMNSSLSSVYPETAVRGTSNPHLGWSHTDAQGQSFHFKITHGIDRFDTRTEEDVMNDRRWLERRLYRNIDYSFGDIGVVTPPNKVIITKGVRVWEGQIVQLNIREEGGEDIVSGYPLLLDVILNLRVTVPRLGGTEVIY
jgi:hypothetical protein